MSSLEKTDFTLKPDEFIPKMSYTVYQMYKVKRLIAFSFWFLGIQVLAYKIIELAGMNSISEEGRGACIVFGMITLCIASWNFYECYFQRAIVPHFYRSVLFLLIMWGCITIIRSFNLDFNDLRLLFAQKILGWNWLVPVAFFLGTSLSLWQKVLPIMVVHVQLGVLFGIVGYFSLGSLDTFGLAYAAPLLLIFYYKLPKIAKYFSVIGTVFYIYINVISDNRTLVVGALALILSSIIVHTLRSHRYKVRNQFVIITLSSAVFLSAFFLSDYYMFPGSNGHNSKQLTEYSAHLADRSSRTNLASGFFESSNTLELLFGRGALGRYHWYTYRWKEGRDAIENGWLFIVLKGGFVMVFLFSLLAIPAAIKGIFFSKNWFARGCGFIVLERLFEMIPYGLPSATLPYVIFWMAIGGCFSKTIRNIPEKEIMKINICPVRRIHFKW